jgi:hypothetical protein
MSKSQSILAGRAAASALAALMVACAADAGGEKAAQQTGPAVVTPLPSNGEISRALAGARSLSGPCLEGIQSEEEP